MVARSPTTTSRRSRRCTWFCVCAAAACELYLNLSALPFRVLACSKNGHVCGLCARLNRNNFATLSLYNCGSCPTNKKRTDSGESSVARQQAFTSAYSGETDVFSLLVWYCSSACHQTQDHKKHVGPCGRKCHRGRVEVKGDEHHRLARMFMCIFRVRRSFLHRHFPVFRDRV